MATYYIEVDTYWQNSDSYFVGPFVSADAAREWYADVSPADNVWLATSTCGGDIRTAWRVYPEPLSATAARKRGMRELPRDAHDNTLPISTTPNAFALRTARRNALELV